MLRYGILIACLISSCQDERLSDDPTQSLVDGTWQSACLQEDGRFRMARFQFYYASYAERIDSFYDDECQENLLYETSYNGEYELSVTWASYIHRLRFDVGQAALRVQDAEAANAQALCGRNTWSEQELSMPELLQLENCPLKFTGGFVYDTLLRVQNNQIEAADQFGPTDGLSQEFTEASEGQSFNKVF
ncbi:hypothetical protein [Pseudobacteriovorax antillogorgiicola]|nr:hypothetical protein [Pseudobacteriovorax antillogorgiicola]